jgi:hypothetical protein
MKSSAVNEHTSEMNQKFLNFQFSSVYIELFEVTSLVSKILAFPVAYYIAIDLLGTVFTCFEIISNANSWQQSDVAMTMFVMNLQFMAYSVAALGTCSIATNESRSLAIELLSFAGQKKLKKVQVIVGQMEHMQVTFSCGLFAFNLGVFMMVSRWFNLWKFLMVHVIFELV